MLYVGYKFEITRQGICFVDSNSELEPHNMMKMPEGYHIGDTFVLCQTANGNVFLRRSDQRIFNEEFESEYYSSSE